MSRRVIPLLVALVAMLGVGAAGAEPARPLQTGDVAYDAGLQWALAQIGAEEAWQAGTGAGVTIAVVDSGAALDHEDLAAQLVAGVACRDTDGDPENCTGSPADDDGHGSHVAGIAAARTGNEVGVAGVAPDARIMPVKVLFRACPNCESAGNSADVAAGIRWAVDHGASVINLSLGSTTSAVFGPGFADAVRYAWERGAVPVVAAGNEFVLTADFGDAPAVVVSATDRDDAAPSYSNGVGRARWAVAAPGGQGGDTRASCSQDGAPLGILSTYWAPDDPAAYACLSGTSMAAPHVAGGLAILLGAGLSPAQAVAVLLETATDLGAPGRDDVFGNGRIDLAAAASRIASPPDVTDTVAPPPPPTVGPSDAAPPASGTTPPVLLDTPPQPPEDETSELPLRTEDDEPVTILGTMAAAAIVADVVLAVVLRRRAMRRLARPPS